jgi:hypothetical protein
MAAHDPQLLAFFDMVLEKIAEHPSYGQAVSAAAQGGRPLALNYHTHGPGQGYCASVCALDGETPDFGGLLRLGGELEELAHIRGIGQSEAECGQRMSVFAARLRDRYRLGREPEIYLNGRPWQGPDEDGAR